MDLVSLVRLAAKRWYVTLPVLAATVVAAVLLQQDVPREYHANGALLLADRANDVAGSPVRVVDIGLASRQLQTREERDALADRGATADYVIRPSIDGLTIEVTGASQQEINDTADVLIDRLTDHVRESQQGTDIPEEERLIPRSVDAGIEVVGPTPGEVELELRAAGESALTEEQLAAEVAASRQLRLTVEFFLDDPLAQVRNPLGADGDTVALIRTAITSEDGLEELAALTGDPDLQFDVTSDGSGIIRISTMGTDERTTLEAFDHVHARFADELEARQDRAEVAVTRRIVTEVLAEPRTAEDVTSPIDRAVAAVVALGGLLALGLVLLVENVAQRRSRATGDPRTLAHEPVPERNGDAEGLWAGALDPDLERSRTREPHSS